MNTPVKQSPQTIETEFPVRYAETDAMGVVHHASYLVYFEEGRSQYMRELGNDYANIEASGFRLPVSEVGVRYLGSFKYGDRVRIKSWVEENKSRRLSFAYELSNTDSEDILVTGFTRHIWTDLVGNVTRIPEDLRKFFDFNRF
jgi:acyl-CoA thioester hydrolase